MLTHVHHLAGLLLPRRCSGCDVPLHRSERDLCSTCLGDLPLARMLCDAQNPVARLFWGRVPLQAAAAFLQFRSGGKVQHLLHRLKYKGDRHVGLALGRLMGAEARTSPLFNGVDTVMAVPLHRRKERARGFNQAQVLVDGLRERWPLNPGGVELRRVLHTGTQTKRNRWERWRNVEAAFAAGTSSKATMEGAHVLLVDDVVTTGATLESCANALLKLPGVRVSVLTAAHA